MPLAPVLLDLQQTVEQIIDQNSVDEGVITDRFSTVRDFLSQSVGLFREVESTLYVDEIGLQKLDLCSQEIEATLEALDRLQAAVQDKKMFVLKERLGSFISSHKRCLEYFAEFSRQAQEQPIYSPVPSLDAFIKTGIKVVEKQLPKERLEERFPNILPDLDRVRRLVAILPKVHQPPAELTSALASGLQGLENGYGAIQHYLDTDDLVALGDGLKLIGSSSMILDAQLQKTEEIVSASTRFSKFRPLEEWLLLRDYITKTNDPEVPAIWLEATLDQFYSVWDYLLSQAEELVDNPLLEDIALDNGMSPTLFEEQLRIRDDHAEKVDSFEVALINAPESTWTELTPHLETLQDAIKVSLEALDQQLLPYRELPGLERLVYIKRDVKRGSADPAVLRSELQTQLTRVEELIESVRHAKDPISREFHELLPTHRAAFIGMIENLDQNDWEALDARWEGIRSTLPHLANLSRTMRKRLAAESSSSRQIKCLRCGEPNQPERRMCSSCGANLPTMIQKGQTFSEITEDPADNAGGARATVSPKAIDLLESLVSAFEANQTSKKDASEALQLMIDDLNRQRQMFSQKLVPLMGREGTLDTYLQVFAQLLGSYFGSLMGMFEAIQHRQLPQLHSSLSECREALEALEVMKERIDEALRG